MTLRDYALLLLAGQKRDRVRMLKARIRARLTKPTKPTKPAPMGMMKHYLNDLVCACAPDNGFAQEAIEHAITTGQVQLTGTYDLEVDTVHVMNRYDAIVSAYHEHIHGGDRDRLAEAQVRHPIQLPMQEAA